MSKIPPALLAEILADPYYARCARHPEGGCAGRVTFEHAITVAGKQLQRKWAILPLCERHHGVGRYQDTGALDKAKNQYIALSRATKNELHEFPRAQFPQQLALLSRRYTISAWPRT